MIDIQRVRQSLEKYLDNFDISDNQIRLKVSHIYRVSDLSKRLALLLGLKEDDVILAQVIGLLHDIGRFEQIKRYHTFIDKDSIDHGELGCEILFDEGLIRDFIDNDSYDKIIRNAIINHNRPRINRSLRGDSLLHSKIIRDADKTDILYLSTLSDQINIVYGSNKFQKEKISEEVYNDFIRNRKVDYSHIETSADVVLCHLAYIFDYNFDCLLEYIYNENYLDKIYELIHFDDVDSETKFKDCYTITSDYIKKKVKK